jgi:hypothetical protein
MKTTLVTCVAVLAAFPVAAQLQVQTQQVGPTPAPQQGPAPCPGMGGLEIGQTRTFSFERMAKLEPDKAKVTRDVKVTHRPANRPWVITVAYDSDAADAKVIGLYYLVEPVSGIRDALVERYGAGAPMPSDAGVTYWDIPHCSVRLRARARVNERQKPVEELWVDPMPAARGAQANKKG